MPKSRMPNFVLLCNTCINSDTYVNRDMWQFDLFITSKNYSFRKQYIQYLFVKTYQRYAVPSSNLPSIIHLSR